MDKRTEVIIEARRWIGTPYHHQAALRGVGVDCVGLIRGVGFAVGVLPPRHEDWARFNAYGRLPSPTRMAEGMREFLIPVEYGEQQPGDIAWMQWRENLPMHLGILATLDSDRPSIIHSFSDVGFCVEHGLTSDWLARIVSYWRYPEIDQ